MTPNRILITGARAPVAVHLCRLLAGASEVFLADSFAQPLGAASNLHSGYIRLPSPRDDLEGYRAALKGAVAAHNIDLIIPTCEEVFYLAILADRGDLAAPLLAPELGMLTAVHNKFTFMELAQSYGLPVPATTLVTAPAGLRAHDPAVSVFKPVWSRFAAQVLVKPSKAVLAKITPTPDAPWVAQDCVEGDELSIYAVARHGKPVALAIYASVFKAGKGAGVCFAPVQDAAVRVWVHGFIEASKWDGQISFDMIRRADGSVLPLECNPRATSGLHFFREKAAFSAALWGGQAALPDVGTLQASRLALWLYGLPQAVRQGRFGRFRTAIKEAGEILDWPNDPAPVRAQFHALREIAGVAIRQRISLQQASTRDIEWNGPEG